MPDGVGIYDIAFSLDNKLYAAVTGGDGGRIICQPYPGAEWDTLLDPNALISTIIIDQYNNIYAMGNRRLFSSFDNGSTWQIKCIDIISASVCSLYKLNDGNLLIGTWGGIILSDSTGSEYSFVETVSQHEKFKDFQYNIDSTVLYAGSISYYDDTGGIYRSLDNGLTWENHALGGSYVTSLCMNSQGDIFAGSQGHYSLGIGGVYRLLYGNPSGTGILWGLNGVRTFGDKQLYHLKNARNKCWRWCGRERFFSSIGFLNIDIKM